MMYNESLDRFHILSRKLDDNQIIWSIFYKLWIHFFIENFREEIMNGNRTSKLQYRNEEWEAKFSDDAIPSKLS